MLCAVEGARDCAPTLEGWIRGPQYSFAGAANAGLLDMRRVLAEEKSAWLFCVAFILDDG